MENYYKHDKNLHMLFVDFKTYDSVNFGIPTGKASENYWSIHLEHLYCIVRYRGELSDRFEVKSGLNQGDAFSPILFNLSLDRIVRG